MAVCNILPEHMGQLPTLDSHHQLLPLQQQVKIKTKKFKYILEPVCCMKQQKEKVLTSYWFVE